MVQTDSRNEINNAEHNDNATKPLRFIQMWITPRKLGLPPNYGSFSLDATQRSNRWAWLVGDAANKLDATTSIDATTPPAIRINQDANIFVAELDGTRADPLTFHVAAGRQAYVLQVEGSAALDADATTTLARHEAAIVVGPSQLDVVAVDVANNGNAHLLIVEMKEM